MGKWLARWGGSGLPTFPCCGGVCGGRLRGVGEKAWVGLQVSDAACLSVMASARVCSVRERW